MLPQIHQFIAVPQQTNDDECGVFVCRFAYAMFKLRHLQFSYSDAGLHPLKRASKQISENVFQQLITNGNLFDFNMDGMFRLRENFKNLIWTLHLFSKKWKNEQQSSPLIDIDNTQSYSNSLSSNVVDGATNSPSNQILIDHDSSLDMKKRPPKDIKKVLDKELTDSESDAISITSSEAALSHTSDEKKKLTTCKGNIQKLQKTTILSMVTEFFYRITFPQ